VLVIKFVLEEHMLWGGCTKSFSIFLIVCLLAVCLPIPLTCLPGGKYVLGV